MTKSNRVKENSRSFEVEVRIPPDFEGTPDCLRILGANIRSWKAVEQPGTLLNQQIRIIKILRTQNSQELF